MWKFNLNHSIDNAQVVAAVTRDDELILLANSPVSLGYLGRDHLQAMKFKKVPGTMPTIPTNAADMGHGQVMFLNSHFRFLKITLFT